MSLKKIYALAVVNLLLCAACSCSFCQSVPVIGLKQAVDSAIKNYPGLEVKEMQLQSADAGITDAKHQGLPSLKIHDQLDAGTANSIGGSYFPLGIIPSTSGGIRSDNSTSLASGNIAAGYSEYELYTFGMKNARVESAKALQDESAADYQKTAYSLQYHVAQLYFNILKYNLLSVIQQKNIDRYQVLYKYIKAYTGSGIKAGVDSSVANAEVSKAKIQHIQTLATLDQLKSEFVFYTGIHIPSFDVDTSFYHLSVPVINQLEMLVAGDSVNYNNPVLKYYKSKFDYSRSQEKLIKRSYLPKIYVLGEAWTRGSSISSKDVYGDLPSGLNYSRYNYMLGLAFTYNVVDVLHLKDKAAIQYYQTQAVRSEMKEQEQLLFNQLHQSDIAIQAAMDKIKEIPIQLKASREAYSQKLAQYNAGTINVVELTNVAYLLYQAETNELDTKSELLNTLLQKAATNNTLNVFLNHF